MKHATLTLQIYHLSHRHTIHCSQESAFMNDWIVCDCWNVPLCMQVSQIPLIVRSQVSLEYSDFRQSALSRVHTLPFILDKKHLLTQEETAWCVKWLSLFISTVFTLGIGNSSNKQTKSWIFSYAQAHLIYLLLNVSYYIFGQPSVKIRCITFPAHQTMWLVEECAITFLSNQTYHFHLADNAMEKKPYKLAIKE